MEVPNADPHQPDPGSGVKALFNGHWETVKRVSHLTGWIVAAFLAGAHAVGWIHIQESNRRYAEMRADLVALAAIVRTHELTITRLDSAMDLRVRELDRRVTKLE